MLAAWIANNWRPDVLAPNVKDLVWRRKKEEFEEVLKIVLDVKGLDASSPGYFQQHMAAAKVILDGLSVQEREELDAVVAQITGREQEDDHWEIVTYDKS